MESSYENPEANERGQNPKNETGATWVSEDG